MAELKVSQLSEAISVADSDLLDISQDQGVGNYISKKVTFSNLKKDLLIKGYLSVPFTDQTVVNVIHNFGAYPIVQCFDSNNQFFIEDSRINNTINDFTVTFSTSKSGIIIASLGTSFPQRVISTSASYNISSNDRIVNISDPNRIATLNMAASESIGREFVIDNSSNGNLTIIGINGDTIQGQPNKVLATNTSARVYSNGIEWRIIG